MKFKKLLAAVGATALLAGVGLLAAQPASAHTPSVSADCQALTVNLTNYAQTQPGKDSVYKDVKVIDTPAVAEVSHFVKVIDTAAVPGVPAVPAVTHTEYEFKQFITGNLKWNADRWWNPGLGWFFDGNTKIVIDKAAIPAVPAIPEVSHQVKVIDVPGVAEVSHIDHQLVSAAVPAKTNTVKVTIDGTVVEDTTFSSSFTHNYTFANKYVAHTWNVLVTAWDSSQYNLNQSGTSTPCAVPVVNANLKGDLHASCGVADLTLTNPEEPWTDNKTGAVTVWIDGAFKEAITVAGDATETRQYTFAEDSGDHTVVVKAAESDGGAVLLSATVKTDCELPQVTPVAPTVTDVEGCGVYGSVTAAETEGVTYAVEFNKETGAYTVTATALEGYEIAQGAETVFTGNVGAFEECPTVIPVVVAPTFTDLCGTDNDSTTLGTGEGYIEEKTVSEDGKTVTVRALASEGFVFADGVQTLWEHTFTDEACPTVVVSTPPTTPTDGVKLLAKTGSDQFVGWVTAGSFGVALLILGGLLGFSRRKKA
jgi:LPXTG-motif cell wall-anchored protein